jgi:hypothetical protein
MQLVKEGKYTEIVGDINLSRVEDIITFMIDYYQSTFIINKDNWLTKRERSFFVACVIISNKGYKYTSPEAKKIYKELFNLRRQSDVRGYLSDLEDKGFLKSNVNNKIITLPEFFKFNIDEQRVKIDITLNYKDGKAQ